MIESKNYQGSVLIVDDTPRNIQILGSLLRQHGFLVSVAQNGQQAFDIAGKAMPDLILLDIMMPGMDGYQTLSALKQNESTANIPVIFITAVVEKEKIVKGLEMGAVDYITKPFNLREVISRVTTHVNLKKTNETFMEEKNRAVEATRLKDKFVSLVAHDLRTPFNTILGFMNIVYTDKQDELSPQHKILIGRAIENGNRLVEMIDQLLDLSRLQTGSVIPEPRFINVRQTISAVGWDLSKAARDKGVTINIQITDDLGFYTDPNLFTEVARNIIANAIKFSNKDGVISIFVPEGGGACLAVKDTGVGIKASMLPDLFKQEVKTTTTGTGGERGTGLGLPFCAEIMRILGGSISVESEHNKGSVFYIRLPHVKPVILLVEDEPEDRKLIKGYLKDINVEIVEAENGKQAMEKLEKYKPHLVILDVMLPIMNGYDTLKSIRHNPAAKNIPVIAVSVSGKSETSEKAIQLGANDFVSKPFSIHDLIPRVKRFISLGS